MGTDGIDRRSGMAWLGCGLGCAVGAGVALVIAGLLLWLIVATR